MKKNLFALMMLGSVSTAYGNCEILNSSGQVQGGLSDAVSATLAPLGRCPTNVVDFKSALQESGMTTEPSMVANRGRHNPRFGSFSFFEVANGQSQELGVSISAGHLYFGHFTGAAGGTLVLDQSPAPGKLLIELIAWDFDKQMYNFYELIGTRSGGRWFYRGDSSDAFADIQKLHRQDDPQRPVFGRRMRCSGCHTSGGPIMKELEAPHNDWWTAARPLPLGGHQPSQQVEQWLGETVDASSFSAAVKTGIKMLAESSPMQEFKSGLTLQEQLRPLFCTTEINIVSDQQPLEGESASLAVPSDLFVNSFFGKGEPIEVNKGQYIQVLNDLGFRFLETNRIDADHAWLAPVKGFSDYVAIQALIEEGIIDQEFAADVLAIDMSNPLFSSDRCGLLALVPASSEQWQEEFATNLEADGGSSAQELLVNLTLPERDLSHHEAVATELLAGVSFETLEEVSLGILALDELRKSVFANEIYQNPLGQILEQPAINRPGFRIVFPTLD